MDMTWEVQIAEKMETNHFVNHRISHQNYLHIQTTSEITAIRYSLGYGLGVMSISHSYTAVI